MPSLHVESHSPLVFKCFPCVPLKSTPCFTPRSSHGLKSVGMAQNCQLFVVVYTSEDFMQIWKFNSQKLLWTRYNYHYTSFISWHIFFKISEIWMKFQNGAWEALKKKTPTTLYLYSCWNNGKHVLQPNHWIWWDMVTSSNWQGQKVRDVSPRWGSHAIRFHSPPPDHCL